MGVSRETAPDERGRLSTTSNHLAGTNPVIGMVKRE